MSCCELYTPQLALFQMLFAHGSGHNALVSRETISGCSSHFGVGIQRCRCQLCRVVWSYWQRAVSVVSYLKDCLKYSQCACFQGIVGSSSCICPGLRTEKSWVYSCSWSFQDGWCFMEAFHILCFILCAVSRIAIFCYIIQFSTLLEGMAVLQVLLIKWKKQKEKQVRGGCLIPAI